MRIHRFFIKTDLSAYTASDSGFTIDDKSNKELVHQLFHVFRYEVGQNATLFDGSGSEYEAEITEISKKGIRFVLNNTKKGLNQDISLKKQLMLCFSLIKKDNIELILQKCTELGVTEFYPMLTDRSEKKDFNIERGEKIIIEAAEQSGWDILPILHEVMSLEEVIQETKGMKQVLFHVNTDHPLTPSFAGGGTNADKIALFIGAEGGWSDNEIELFKKYDVEFQSLGEQTLRAETAAIAGVMRAIK